MSSRLILSLLCLLPGLASAQSDGRFFEEYDRSLRAIERRDGKQSTRPPEFDVKAIINESAGFLKEREPEMTTDEYAIYERVVGMLTTRPAFALQLLEAMVGEKEEPSPAFAFILGNAYYAAGENAKSEASYLKAIERYPTFLRAWANLGASYYSTGRYAEAARCFSKCVTLGDREAATFGLLGYSLEQQRRIVPAEMAYMQALSGDPTNTDWLEGLLRISIDARQHGRAEWLVQDLLRQKPGELRYWVAYANILHAQQRKLEAIAVLEVAATAGAAGPSEYLLLADLCADQKLLPEAIAAYQRVIASTPELGERKLITFAGLLISRGELAQARTALDAAGGRLTPTGRVAHQLATADLLAAEGKWPETRRQLELLLQTEPRHGRALLGLGQAWAAEENLPQAQLAFEAALQVPDSAYRACLELAALELRNRHYPKSVEYLRRALGLQRSVPVEELLARVLPLVEENL